MLVHALYPLTRGVSTDSFAHTMRVLLIDDHDMFRAGLALLLRACFPQAQLTEAGTLREGLQHARKEPLNLVFLDLGLPDGNGIDALATLKSERSTLPVIVTSAHVRAESVSRCLDLNAMGYVPKTGNVEELRVAINAALAGGVFLPGIVDAENRF